MKMDQNDFRSEENYFSTQELCEASGISVASLNAEMNGDSALHHQDILTSIQRQEIPPVDVDLQNDPETIYLERTSPPCKKVKRNRIKSGWKSEEQKLKRMKGEEYFGTESVTTPRGRKRTLTKIKCHRSIGETCASIVCQKTKLRKCSEFSEHIRQKIFDEFWKELDWSAKKSFVQSLVDQVQPRNPRILASKQRETTYIYHLKLGGLRRPVCKKMFLSTLGLKDKQLRCWLYNKKKNRGPPPVRGASEGNANAREFLQKLPKLPSHYCRHDTNKFYLETFFTSKSDVYSRYKEFCNDMSTHCISRNSFLNIFKELNIGLYHPKKDQCDTCVSYDSGNYDEERYKLHRMKMEIARSEKGKDKADAAAGKCHLLTMDLQGVLMAPCLKASSMYYKTKLVVHNFTVYDLTTRETTCYVWDESEGELVASVFATCVMKYLEKFEDELPIIIYSDGCTYQNRNAIMSTALLHYATDTRKVITQKYLEKGHTQMEVDSVHALIQRKLKGKTIYLPTDYIEIFSNARTNPAPYEVKYMRHSEFVDYSQTKFQRYSSIRPGNKAGEPQVTDIRQLQYLPDGTIRFKLDHCALWTQMPRQPREVQPFSFPKLYKGMIPIAKRKLKDLLDLLPVIPQECHEFYKKLPSKN